MVLSKTDLDSSTWADRILAMFPKILPFPKWKQFLSIVATMHMNIQTGTIRCFFLLTTTCKITRTTERLEQGSMQAYLGERLSRRWWRWWRKV